MSATHPRPPLASYRDEVAALIGAGAGFGDVEDAIDGIPDVTMNQRAALWLFAFSLRDRSDQLLDARAHLDALE